MKTAELTGALLDYWVAKAERDDAAETHLQVNPSWSPSTNWAHGGPIIDREGISPTRWEVPNDDGTSWTARNLTATVHQSGPTALVAVMRCYVASKFGEEVPDAAL